MKARTWLFLFLLFGMFGAAFLLQSGISRKEVRATPKIPAKNRLDLLVGGDAPLLQLSTPAPSPKPAQKPSSAPKTLSLSPSPNPRSVPSPKPASTKRWIQLQKGQTLYGICKEVLKDPTRLEQVLKLNGWTEGDAKSLKPGTRVILPPLPQIPKGRRSAKRN